MLTTKLAKIKDLIEQKEKIDAELAVLLGEHEPTKRRGRPRGTIAEVQTPEE